MPLDGPPDQLTRTGNRHGKRNTLRIGTISLATLRGKEEEVVLMMKERNLDILGLCETRLSGTGCKLLHDITSLFTVVA